MNQGGQISDLKTQIALLNQEKDILLTQVGSLKKKNLSLSDTSSFNLEISKLEEEIRS